MSCICAGGRGVLVLVLVLPRSVRVRLYTERRAVPVQADQDAWEAMRLFGAITNRDQRVVARPRGLDGAERILFIMIWVGVRRLGLGVGGLDALRTLFSQVSLSHVLTHLELCSLTDLLSDVPVCVIHRADGGTTPLAMPCLGMFSLPCHGGCRLCTRICRPQERRSFIIAVHDPRCTTAAFVPGGRQRFKVQGFAGFRQRGAPQRPTGLPRTSTMRIHHLRTSRPHMLRCFPVSHIRCSQLGLADGLHKGFASARDHRTQEKPGLPGGPPVRSRRADAYGWLDGWYCSRARPPSRSGRARTAFHRTLFNLRIRLCRATSSGRH